MTARQIAPHFNVSFRTILRDLKKEGADVRKPGAPVVQGLQDGDWLVGQYESGKSTTQIADMVGASPRTVNTWLVRAGATMRSKGAESGHSRNSDEAREKMSAAKRGKYLGASNPNWRGGSVHDPERNRYPAKQWSRQVKERDDYTCQGCGANDSLHAHHIKRWKDYPALRYELDNGITLCFSCHEKAHGRGFKFRFHCHAKRDKSALPSKEVKI